MLFYADENEVIIGAKKVTFTGKKNKYCPYNVLLLSPFGWIISIMVSYIRHSMKLKALFMQGFLELIMRPIPLQSTI